MEKVKAFANTLLRGVPDKFGSFAADHPKTVLVVFGVALLIALVMW